MNAAAAVSIAATHVGSPVRLVCRPRGRVHVHVGRLTARSAVPTGAHPVCGQRARRLTALTRGLTPAGGGPARVLCRRCVQLLERRDDRTVVPVSPDVSDLTALVDDAWCSWWTVSSHEEWHALQTFLLRSRYQALIRRSHPRRQPTTRSAFDQDSAWHRTDPACCNKWGPDLVPVGAFGRVRWEPSTHLVDRNRPLDGLSPDWSRHQELVDAGRARNRRLGLPRGGR